SAVPVPDPDLERTRERIEVKGELPSPIDPPSGCVFRTRCPFAQDICSQERPKFEEHKPGHFVACHMLDDEFKHLFPENYKKLIRQLLFLYKNFKKKVKVKDI